MIMSRISFDDIADFVSFISNTHCSFSRSHIMIKISRSNGCPVASGSRFGPLSRWRPIDEFDLVGDGLIGWFGDYLQMSTVTD